MAIGIVSDAEFEKELNSTGNRKEVIDGNTNDLPASNSSGSIRSDIHQDDKQDILEGQVTPVSSATAATSVEIQTLARAGRKDGDVNVPDSLRKLIAEEALLNGRPAAIKLAKQFGISESSVAAYSNGATSTTSYHSPTKSILGHINKSRERAIKRASKTLNQALGAITQEKLDYADVSDLSSIAKDMSVIIKNLEPKQVETDAGQNGPQFVIFAPQFRDERSFETIHVKE